MHERSPYRPDQHEWSEIYAMLCGYCANQLKCDLLDKMIEMKDGGAWPEGGWVEP